MDNISSEYAALFGSFDCDVILPENPDYEYRRKIFNGLIDKHPAVIVRPKSSNAIRQVYLRARETGLPISIKGGGHNVAGHSLVEGGVVIDNSLLRSVVINADLKYADVGPGALWGDFDAAAQDFGLAGPGGIISDTGVAGLTLGGGIGWLNGLYGLSCDNLAEADVVLADGSVVLSSCSENEDLFWGLRGGGGNFGIVTRFRFRLHPLRSVYCGSIVYKLDGSPEVIQRFWEVGSRAPDALTLALVAGFQRGNKVVSIDLCYCGNSEEGKRLTDALLPDDQSKLVADTRAERPYLVWQKAFDDSNRRGRRSYWRSIYIDEPKAAFLEAFNDAVCTMPSEFTLLTFDHIHGYAARVPNEETAYSNRGHMFLLLINSNWESLEQDNLNFLWSDRVFGNLLPIGTAGGYINYLSNEGQPRVKASYNEQNYAKLRQIKSKYDPDNIFRINQNISPSDFA